MKLLARRRRGGRAGAKPEDATLQLQNEAQALRLELAERDRVIARLEGERNGDPSGALRARVEIERLLAGMATPLVQLATQAQLDGVDTGSVLAVARSLLRAVEDEGLEFIGEVGAVEAYDPACHEPLGETAPAAGAPVVIRFVGLSYGGEILRTAAVEPATALGPRRPGP